MKYLSDEEVYEHYLGEKISFHKSFFSPFREEKNASMTFIRMGDGAILWRDWGDGSQNKPESAIDFVMRLYNCSFVEALNHIRSDLKGEHSSFVFRKTQKQERIKEQREIQIQSRKFDSNDFKFWGKYGITLATLTLYEVIPIQQSYYGIYPMNSYDGINPLYAYKLHHNGKVYYKIYNPFAKEYKNKWRYNGTSDILLGYNQLPLSGKLLILTKSLKDVMVLHEMGYNSVSLQSESTQLTTNMFSLLQRRFDTIVVFYDNDKTGVIRSTKLNESYGLQEICVPIENHIKDISDYVDRHNMQEGKILMKKLLNQVGINV
jgi:hypothetical protein